MHMPNSMCKCMTHPLPNLSPPRTDAGTVLSILGKYIRILGKYIWTGLGHDPKIALSAQILDTHSRIDIIISQRRLRCHWRPGHPGHHGVSQSAYHLATAGDAAQLGCGEGGRRLNKDAMRRLGGSTRKGTSRCQMQAPALPNLRVYPPCQMLAPWGLDLAADGNSLVLATTRQRCEEVRRS